MKRLLLLVVLSAFAVASSYAASAKEMYKWMGALEGEWIFDPDQQSQGSCYFENPDDVYPAMAFKYIGAGTTLQENMLPDTAREMVTMYHCMDEKCTKLVATHYCVKRNQPAYIANLEESTPSKFVFECNMENPYCSSNMSHVHKIVHELSKDGQHLKSSYLSWKNKKPVPSTICYTVKD